MIPSAQGSQARRCAFTLLELLVAGLMFAVLAGALYSVFSAALGMRERTYAVLERELPASAALETMRRDLAGMTIPAGTLAGPILGSTGDTGSAADASLEFYTTSGIIFDGEQEPWGDIQKVVYCLGEPERTEDGRGTTPRGRVLLREVTRNLLAPTESEPETQCLLGGVRALEIAYLDQDLAWQDTWDSTALEDAPPRAVRVRIEFEPPLNEAEPQLRPLEAICEIAAQPKEETDEESSESETPS